MLKIIKPDVSSPEPVNVENAAHIAHEIRRAIDESRDGKITLKDGKFNNDVFSRLLKTKR